MPGKPYTGRTAEQVRDVIRARSREMAGGCWEWQRGLTAQGYPSLSWLGVWGGHRVSYAAFVGPIPEGLHVCHSCDNRKCVNPAHLFVGTAADNNADMDAKGRSNRVGFSEVLRGERHPSARLSDAEADAIRASGERGRDLARRYGVAEQTVCNIRKGRRRVLAGER